jgi:hypothetical protein
MCFPSIKALHITRPQAALGIQLLMLIGLLPLTVIGITTHAPLPTVLLNVALFIAGCVVVVALWRERSVAYPALVALSIANSVLVPPPEYQPAAHRNLPDARGWCRPGTHGGR